MIVRIMGVGQLEVPDEQLPELEQLDESLAAAVEAGDEAWFRGDLARLLGQVRSAGTALAEDRLEPSDLVVPGPDASLDEVRALLISEGLIPG